MAIRGSTLDGVRQRNLSAVLELVHRDGAVSRSQITAATGLNRSTVAALVAELGELGLLREGSPRVTNRVGRPSPLVSIAEPPVALAVNPEVDAVTVGVVGLDARVEQRVRREVDHVLTPSEVADMVAAVLAELDLDDRRVMGVGLAVPGLVRAADGVVRWAPHLGWRDQPVAELVAERLGLPAHADNDASLGARAEHLFGVGRGIGDIVYLNGGASGIGGGVIVNGVALRGTGGYAGEFGHNRPGFDAPGDRRSDNGVLEDEVSQARLLAGLGLASADDVLLHDALLAQVAGSPARLEAERQRRILAGALANAINVLNPQLVVLGGFLDALLALDPAGLDALVRSHTEAPNWEGARIVPAALGENRLLIGAAELVFDPLIADPHLADSLEEGNPVGQLTQVGQLNQVG